MSTITYKVESTSGYKKYFVVYVEEITEELKGLKVTIVHAETIEERKARRSKKTQYKSYTE